MGAAESADGDIEVSQRILLLAGMAIFSMGATAAAAEETVAGGHDWSVTLRQYVVTMGWALTGSLSMGLGIVITLKLFDLCTHGVDEWDLIKKGNIPVAIILSAVILSLAIVVAAAIRP